MAIDTTVFPDACFPDSGRPIVEEVAMIPVPWSIGVLTYENNDLTVAVPLF